MAEPARAEQAAPVNKELEAYVLEKSSSKFNYVAGYFSNIGIVSFLYSRAILHTRGDVLSLGQIAGWTAFGLFLWSFMEYWLHRWLYHRGPAVFEIGHRLHHEHPKALLGIPYYVTFVIWLGLYYALSLVIDPSRLAVVMASSWIGYISYCAVHHSAHHWLLKFRPLKYLRSHHLQHHYHADKNFGMVTDLWDFVFGTHL